MVDLRLIWRRQGFKLRERGSRGRSLRFGLAVPAPHGPRTPRGNVAFERSVFLKELLAPPLSRASFSSPGSPMCRNPPDASPSPRWFSHGIETAERKLAGWPRVVGRFCIKTGGGRGWRSQKQSSVRDVENSIRFDSWQSLLQGLQEIRAQGTPGEWVSDAETAPSLSFKRAAGKHARDKARLWARIVRSAGEESAWSTQHFRRSGPEKLCHSADDSDHCNASRRLVECVQPCLAFNPKKVSSAMGENFCPGRISGISA